MKISFIATVYNEEKTIGALLNSLLKQTKTPDEIIIVDGGSTDATTSVISNFQFPIFNQNTKNKFPKLKIVIKNGNRSVGRNEGIRQASGDTIICSDAGCELDSDWVKNIAEPFKDLKIDVVAGYYQGKPENVFQKCLVPYVLVMPDKVDLNNFLPASRSMAFTKKIWEKVGGFPEEYSHNEDYVFAHRLKKNGAKIIFAKNAVVYWLPRKNIKEAYLMFFRFAYGDAEAGILRPKVAFIFTRYFFGILLIISYLILRSPILLTSCYLLLSTYIVWSIVKSFKYILHWQSFLFLPILQVVSDIAVIFGTSKGFIKRWIS